jgi:hypothetical protein
VQEAYAAALERDTLPGYEEFLAAYSGDPLAKRVRAIVAARREAITWLRTYRADTPQAYWSYLRRYPRGPHASDARRRLAILTAPLDPPPAFAIIDYDVPPPPPDEIVYVDRPVLMFSDPEFDFEPPPPPPVFFLPPPPPDFVVLEPPPPPIGLFILPQPFFVPIPVYVQPPVYVAPPPNNIIFANIHNTTVINTVINQPPQPAPTAPGAAPAAPGTPNGRTNAAAAPVSPAAAARGAPAQGGVTPPPAVRQKAMLIQQGKLPVPQSASMGPAAKPATAGAPSGQKAAPITTLQTNVSPNAPPPGQTLRKLNALPVPGKKGGPPVPPSATGPMPNVPNPNAKLVPPNQLATTPPAPVTNAPAPLVGQPKAGGSAPAPEVKPVIRETTRNPKAVPPPPTPPSKPAAALAKPVPPPPKPQIQRPEPPRRAAATPPPAPPRQAPQVARPAPPPPPRMAAPPPPRPAPPPPPRPAPQIARPAPPPPAPPRPAAPPPRPAAPAAAKKCPPNVPKC